MAHKIFWLVLQGIVEIHNQLVTLQDMSRFLLYELQKQIVLLEIFGMELNWMLHLILLLMEQQITLSTLQMVLWYSQTVPHSLLRSLLDCWLSYMHRERERVHRMQ